MRKEKINALKRLMLTELRAFIVSGCGDQAKGRAVLEAVTVNEELLNAGLTLDPKGIVLVSKMPSGKRKALADNIMSAIVKTPPEPMYPDFPKQVMQMDEATFRVHQVCHYFSTYGLEAIFDREVAGSWMPDVEKTEKSKGDDALLNAKVIKLVEFSKKGFNDVLCELLSKRDRLTSGENQIVELLIEAMPELNFKIDYESFDIKFKENINLLFAAVLESKEMSSDEKANIIKNVCQNTMDVLKCAQKLLNQKKWKLTTSQKKTIVKALEKFDAKDFSGNLAYSRKRSNKFEKIIKALSFNKFAKSEDHIKAVNQLRDGALKSWYATAEDVLMGVRDGTTAGEKAVAFLAQRPGIAVRKINEMLKCGIGKDEIVGGLLPRANGISSKTLVRLMAKCKTSRYIDKNGDYMDVFSIAQDLLEKKIKSVKTQIYGKSIAISERLERELKHSYFTNVKDQNVGYYKPGMSMEIPSGVRKLRMFAFWKNNKAKSWNDATRVDIDVHALINDENGRIFHCGWNGDFKGAGFVHSGDITTGSRAGAAEYIDIDIESAIESGAEAVTFFVNSFTRQKFKNITNVRAGMLAVNNDNEDVKLYNEKNCILSNDINSNETSVVYMTFDLRNRMLTILDEAKNVIRNNNIFDFQQSLISEYTIWDYLESLIKLQECTVISGNVDRDADLEDEYFELVLGHPKEKRQLSLIDNNFFLNDLEVKK